MAANANIVDELVVLLRLDASSYKKADKEIDRLASNTERKAKTRDKDQQKRFKESAAAARQFAGSLKSLALTIGSVLGISGGAAGLVGAVVALTNFETNLRRATVSTGLSNREMQAWGSAARRLGADAQAGAQAIADLAREQKQFHLTGNAPTLQALNRLGINANENTPLTDILANAQRTYRSAGDGQRAQIESGLAASGVSNDLILLIKSEKDVREEFSRSFAESADENRQAMDSVTDALESVKNSAINVANALAAIVQPNVEAFAQWVSTATSGLSGFNDRVRLAGGGVEGFMAVLNKESPDLAAALRGLGKSAVVLGETVDVVVYGFQSLYRGTKQLFDWLDQKFGTLTGRGEGQLKGAVGTVGDAIKWAWNGLVGEARREGAAPVGTISGSAGGVRLTPSAQARVAAGELNARGAPAVRPSSQDIIGYLTANGLTLPQAVAVAVNAQAESSLNPGATNVRGGGQGAQGLLQWRGSRIDAFRGRYGVSPNQATWQQQMEFLLTDPFERQMMNRSFGGANNTAELGAAFSRTFERHGSVAEDARRGRQAAQLAQQYNPATGGAVNGPQIAINGPVTVRANNPTEFIGGITRQSNVQNFNSAVR